MVYYIIGAVILMIVGMIIGLYINKKYSELNTVDSEPELPTPVEKPYNYTLSYDECNKILDNVIIEIWENKYFKYYRLKDVVVIPKMDEEIVKFDKDVLSSLSGSVTKELLHYYSSDFLIQRIHRKAEDLFFTYTKNFKPGIK